MEFRVYSISFCVILTNVIWSREISDWQTIHNHIHKLLCSIHSRQEIKKSLECLFERFLHTPVKTSNLNFICERLLVVLTNDHLDNVDWLHILQLISVIVTCIKGGVGMIKYVIRQLLLTLFSGSTVKLNNNDNNSNNTNLETFELDYLDLLDDAFNHEENVDESTANASSANALPSIKERDKQRLIAALLIARQLCSEDSRLTGITYNQWWNETFCTPLPTLSSLINTTLPSVDSHSFHPSCILSSRHTIFYFTDLLIDLLPWENDIKFLHVQLNTKPNWFNTTTGKKSINTRVKPSSSSPSSSSLGDHNHLKNIGLSNVLHEEDTGGDIDMMTMMMVPVDLLSGDGTTTNNNSNNNIDYMEACLNRWNDYCEIGRGRLAELREHYHSTKDVLMIVESKTSNRPESCSPTPGWCDVLNWLNEIASQGGGDNSDKEISSCRLLSKVNEANLFRPRWLRCTIIPALLHATEIENLSSELKEAREQLLTTIRTAGLSHLLDNSPTTTTTTGIKQTGISKKRLGSTSVSVKSSNKKVKIGCTATAQSNDDSSGVRKTRQNKRCK